MSQMYMLIDTTVLDQTRVVLVGDMYRVQLHGRLLKAQGKKVIAPPLLGRGFSKLEKLNLQYLFWNHCKTTPPEEYSDLIQRCVQQIGFIEPDKTPIEELERACANLEPMDGEPAAPKPKKERAPKDPNAPAGGPPKKTSTTGLVWVLADELVASLGRMPTRQEVLAKCTEEGINPATASTQYSKWKGSKNTG